MVSKLVVAVLFGGKSAEHAVSVASSKNIIQALNKDKYILSEVFIEENGEITEEIIEKIKNADVVFPVLHGPFGEDGSMQGLLKQLNKAYVGAGVLGSAVGMDKDVMKRLLRDSGIPICKFVVLRKSTKTISKEITTREFEKIVKELGLPFFLKPANLGSSIGVHKVHTKKEFDSFLFHAFSYDTKVILEEYIQGREIECSVLGNESLNASCVGEILLHHEFYDYAAKYNEELGSDLKIPADLPEQTVKRIQTLAMKTFETLCCEGLARVDFFLREKEIFVNEINTLPGFTNISMYPKLWEASGVTNEEVVDQLIQLALERFERQARLRTTIS